jgi:hypothetical protein
MTRGEIYEYRKKSTRFEGGCIPEPVGLMALVGQFRPGVYGVSALVHPMAPSRMSLIF